MVKNFKEWCEAVAKERMKLKEVEEWLSSDGLDRLNAFCTLDDLTEYAADAKDMLTCISNDRNDLSWYEIEQLESRHLAQTIKCLQGIVSAESSNL